MFIVRAVSSTTKFLWRHKWKMLFGTVITAGVAGYATYRKMVNLASQMQVGMASDIARQYKLRVRSDCEASVKCFMPDIKRRLRELVDTASPRYALKSLAAKNNGDDKFVHWDRLKTECRAHPPSLLNFQNKL